MNKYELREYVKESMPKMKVTIYQLRRLIEMHVPGIYKQLQEKEIGCELFCVQWFITIFSYDFDGACLYTIWDLFLVRRWKFIFQMSIAILRAMSGKIASLESDGLLHYMKSAIRDKSINEVWDLLHFV